MTNYNMYQTLPTEPSAPYHLNVIQLRKMTKAGREEQEETQQVLSDLELTDVAKHLFEWPKCGLWNIECGSPEYGHQSFCEYPLECPISGWSE